MTTTPEIRRSSRARRPPQPVYEVQDTRHDKDDEEHQRDSDDEDQDEQAQEDQATSGEEEQDDEDEEADEFAAKGKVKAKPKATTKKSVTPKKPPLAPSSRNKVKAIAQAQARANAKVRTKASVLKLRKGKLRPVREEPARKKSKTLNGDEAAEHGDEQDEEKEDEGDEEEANDVLFEAVKRGKCSLDNLLEEWRERFTENEEEGAREVLNFILQSCGGSGDCVPVTEPLSKLDMADLVEIVVEDLQQRGDNYPIASRHRDFKQFQSIFTAFWKHFVEECVDSEILFTKTLVDDLVDWLTSLSSAEVRAIRHTTAIAANAIGNGLVECASKLSSQAAINDRQLKVAEEAASPATSTKKTPPRGGRGKNASKSLTTTPPSSRRMNHLTKTKQLLETRLNKCLQLINNLFSGVVVHRYRDVMPEIRKETISTLGCWLRTFPGEFLKNSYLKYLGWMLNDKNAEVRGAVLDDLRGLFENEELAREMEFFTTRFMPRFIELCSDTDDEVVHKSIRLLIEIDRRGLINAEVDLQPIESLVFDKNNAAVRKAAAEFVCLQYSAFGISEAAKQQQQTPTGKKKTAKKAAQLNKEQLHTQAIALVEFAEDYLTDSLSSKAVTAAVDTFVDAFWGLKDCQVLQDCQLMTRLLLADKDAPDLTSEQQTILIRILVASVDKLLSSSDTKADAKRQLAKQKEELGVFFCKELAHLLGLYQSDETKVELLVKLIALLPLTSEVVDQHLKNVKALLDRLMVVYLGSSQEKQLKVMSFAIHHLVQSENESLKREANAIIHELFEKVVEQTANSLTEDEDLFSRKMHEDPEAKKRKSPKKENGSTQRELDVEFAVRACLCRLKCLIQYFNPRVYLSNATSSSSQDQVEEAQVLSSSQEQSQIDRAVTTIGELIERRTKDILGISKCFWTADTIANAMMILHCDLLWLLEPVFAKKNEEEEDNGDNEDEDATEDMSDGAVQKTAQKRAAKEQALAECIDKVKTSRSLLERALVSVLQMHLKQPGRGREADENEDNNKYDGMELEELPLEDAQVAAFVRDSQRMAFLVFCDARCLFVEKFGRAVEPYNQLEWSLPANLSNLSQIYFATETEAQEPEEEEDENKNNEQDESSETTASEAHKQKQRAMLVAAFGKASLCNPNSKRQAAAVLRHIINAEKDAGDVAKSFSRIIKAESPIRYLEIQMLSLRQLFNNILAAKDQLEEEELDDDAREEVDKSITEDESALKDLAKKLSMSLGVGKVPTSLRAPFFRFVCEGVRFALEKPAHFLFLEAMRCFLKHLDKTSVRQLLKYFLQLLDQIDDIPEDKEALDAGWKLMLEFQSTLTNMAGKPKDESNKVEDRVTSDDKDEHEQAADNEEVHEEDGAENHEVNGEEEAEAEAMEAAEMKESSKRGRKDSGSGNEVEQEDSGVSSKKRRKTSTKEDEISEITNSPKSKAKTSRRNKAEAEPEEDGGAVEDAAQDDDDETDGVAADNSETEASPHAEVSDEEATETISTRGRPKRKRQELSTQSKKDVEEQEEPQQDEDKDDDEEDEIDSRRTRRRRKSKE